MNETRRKPYIRIILLVIALFIAGLVGYKLGSDNMTHKWMEASQEVVPGVIDYVIEMCEYAPSNEILAESHKELIRTEGLLLFTSGTWLKIDPEGFWEAMERYK